MNRTRVERIGLILIAALVVVGALGGGYAWGHTSATPSAPVAQSSAPPPAQPSKGTVKTGKTKTGKTNAPAVRGSLTAIDGDAWTVQTANNGTVTVTVGADTKFGTAKAAAARSDFTVGKQVLVTGVQSGSTGAATRVAMGQATTAAPMPTTPAAPVPTR